MKNAIRYLRQNDFDGLDVDWEFPGTRGSDAGDRILFTAMLKVGGGGLNGKKHGRRTRRNIQVAIGGRGIGR